MEETKQITVPVKPKEPSPSTIQFSMLSATNYTVWAMRMKVALKVHKAWETIELGSTEGDKNDIATALVFQSIPKSLILQIGEQGSAKKMWDAIRTCYVGAERVREARLRTLNADFDRLTMKGSNMVDDFAGKLFEMASKSAALGEIIDEPKLVKKFSQESSTTKIHSDHCGS